MATTNIGSLTKKEYSKVGNIETESVHTEVRLLGKLKKNDRIDYIKPKEIDNGYVWLEVWYTKITLGYLARLTTNPESIATKHYRVFNIKVKYDSSWTVKTYWFE